MKKITPKIAFRLNQKLPGKILNINISKGGNHPPKNKMVTNELISSILAYSPKKKEQMSLQSIQHYNQKPIQLQLQVNRTGVYWFLLA